MSLQSFRDINQTLQDASIMTVDDRRICGNAADEIFMPQKEFRHSTSLQGLVFGNTYV
jgi:hypothetical protein